VAQLAAGEPVVLVGPDRAELVIPALGITASHVRFLVCHARGPLRVALTAERAAELELVPVRCTRTGLNESWCINVEARSGVTTGIAACDRARTIATLADPHSTPDDLVSPGHILPVIAGLHGRRAHEASAEAAVELMRRAGRGAVAALCPLLARDGSLADAEEIRRFTAHHGLPVLHLYSLAPHPATRRFTTAQRLPCAA
jgi:3,4-dihydroxy-2-butanone 4-phosphate synthase